MKKIYLTAILAGVLVSNSSLSAFASDLNNDSNTKTNISVSQDKNNSNKTSNKIMDQEVHKQLVYAIEEMKEAITLLDSSDFTNQSNYDRMIAFATAS